MLSTRLFKEKDSGIDQKYQVGGPQSYHKLLDNSQLSGRSEDKILSDGCTHGVLGRLKEVKKKSNKNQNEKLSVLGKTLQTVGRSSGLADASRGREGGQWSLSLLQVYQPVLHQPIPAAPDTDVKGAFGKSQLPGTRVLLQENDKDILSSKWKRKSMAQKRRRAVSTAASSEGLPTAGNPPTHPTSGIKDLCRHTGMVSHP
nr:sperm acrosome-associated protein 7 isoform X2 [Equus asinus]